jgi:transglutaminase-like putative cysteine protease
LPPYCTATLSNGSETDKFLSVAVDLTAELNVINPFDFFLEPSAEKFPFDYAPELLTDLRPYLRALECGATFRVYLDRISRESRQTTGFQFDLNAQLQRDIGYLIRMEPGIETPDETLEKHSGSCRDSAWLLVQLLRHLGLAARFASGYLIQLKPDQKSLDRPSGAEADFTDLHAWCRLRAQELHAGPAAACCRARSDVAHP